MTRLDAKDLRILALLQEQADLSVSEIGERVGLTTTPCWRRIQRLEAEGFIRRRVALLDPGKLNVGTVVFVAIRTNRHDIDWLEAFAAAVEQIPEIVELYRLSGEIDYLMKIVVPDIAGYDRVYKRLISAVPMYDVSSSFAMEQVKATTALPLTYAEAR